MFHPNTSNLYPLRDSGDWKTTGRFSILLYGREDTTRRRLFGLERLEAALRAEYPRAEIEHLRAMPKSFRDQMHLLYRTDVFVQPSGASNTNVIFMRSHSVMLDFRTGSLQTWPHMYGYTSHISCYKDPIINSSAWYGRCRKNCRSSAEHFVDDDDYVINNEIVDVILSLLDECGVKGAARSLERRKT